jgi:hypothetical protein
MTEALASGHVLRPSSILLDFSFAGGANVGETNDKGWLPTWIRNLEMTFPKSTRGALYGVHSAPEVLSFRKVQSRRRQVLNGDASCSDAANGWLIFNFSYLLIHMMNTTCQVHCVVNNWI